MRLFVGFFEFYDALIDVLDGLPYFVNTVITINMLTCVANIISHVHNIIDLIRTVHVILSERS